MPCVDRVGTVWLHLCCWRSQKAEWDIYGVRGASVCLALESWWSFRRVCLSVSLSVNRHSAVTSRCCLTLFSCRENNMGCLSILDLLFFKAVGWWLWFCWTWWFVWGQPTCAVDGRQPVSPHPHPHPSSSTAFNLYTWLFSDWKLINKIIFCPHALDIISQWWVPRSHSNQIHSVHRQTV